MAKDLELKVKATYEGSSEIKKAKEDIGSLGSTGSTSMSNLTRAFSGVTSSVGVIPSALKTMGSVFSSIFSTMGSVVGGIIDTVFSFKTLLGGLFLGIGIGEAIKHFIDLNAEFEKMKVTMDVLTKGHGEEWFNRLNQWALNMPISMAEVTKAFITMKAYGLDPTVKLMENMVNVASVLPESGRAITGIARAIGQIQAKSRLEGQELRQLAEWAVPGYEAVYTKIFKKISERTGKSVGELKFTMIDSATAIKAILETMEEHFGGAAQRIAGTWSGLWIRMTNFVKEFFREIGEGGAMAPLKQQLENIIGWFENAFKTGRLQAWADALGKVLGYAVEAIGVTFRGLFAPGGMGDIGEAAKSTVRVAIGAFYGFLKFIAFIPVAWSSVHGAILSAIGTFTESIRTLISPVIKWYNFLESMPSIPFVKVLGADFEKNRSAVLAFDKTLGGFSDELADNKYHVDLNTQAWEKQYTEVSANLDNLKVKSITTMNDISKNVKPPQILGDVAVQEKQLSFAEQINKIMSEPHKERKGEVKKDYQELADQLIDTAGAFDQIRFAYLAWEKEGRKGSFFKAFQKIFADFANNLKTGYSSAIEGLINGTMKFKDAFQAVIKTIKTSFIKVIADMVAEWMAKQTMMLFKYILFQEGMTAATEVGESERLGIQIAGSIKSLAIAVANGIKQITISAYEAAAAAFAAIAGIPIIGPFLAIGAGAAALGLVLGFASKIAGFEKGTGLMGVKETGPAMLHKGEIVLNKKESDAYRQGANAGSTSSNNVNMSFHINALDGESVEKIVRKQVIPLLRDNIRDFGKARTMIKEAR